MVILVPAAHPDADRQPAAAEHVARRQTFGEHDRVVQLRHDDGRQQPHPVGPGGQRAQQRQVVRVVECDALAPAQ